MNGLSSIRAQRDRLAQFATIVADTEVLYFDEMPVLFTGMNSIGDRIVGSLADLDSEKNLFWYFHAIVSPSDYVSFRQGRTTYRALLLGSTSVFVVRDAKLKAHRSVNLISGGQIPVEYLPSLESYCPDIEPASLSGEFSAKMDGGMARANEADADDAGIIQKHIREFLVAPYNALGRPGASAALVPAMPGSFDIRFRVRRPAQLTFASRLEDEYAREYMVFCLRHFSTEIAAVADANFGRAPNYCSLYRKYIAIRSGAPSTGTDVPADKEFVESISNTAGHLLDVAAVVGKNFSSLEIKSGAFLVGALNESSRSELIGAVAVYEASAHSEEMDATPRFYDLLFYSLNIESQRGGAYLVDGADGTLAGSRSGRKMPKIKVQIVGTGSLKKYSGSLDRAEVIQVSARMRRVDGDPFSLLIDAAVDVGG